MPAGSPREQYPRQNLHENQAQNIIPSRTPTHPALNRFNFSLALAATAIEWPIVANYAKISYMSSVSSLDSFLDPVHGCLTPQVAQRIVDWRPAEQLRARIEELGRKANNGTLTSEEDAEYRDYIDEGDVIALLQAKARRLLPPAG